MSRSGKLVAAPILELLDRLHQPHVSSELNRETKDAVSVFFCDRNNKAQVGFHHFSLGLQCLAHPTFERLVLLAYSPSDSHKFFSDSRILFPSCNVFSSRADVSLTRSEDRAMCGRPHPLGEQILL